MLADAPTDAPVLVAVLPQVADLQRARDHGWYRIPMRRAPPILAASYLAFYQTGVFGAERWAVRYAAPVRAVGIATRRDLLPDQSAHPRADERYYRFDLGPLEALPLAIPSKRLRRITFIPTTVGQLLRARDVVELWHAPENDVDPSEVWGAGVNG